MTGQSHRIYYVMATARTEDAVAHWRQGPYDIFDETVTLPVEIPEPLLASVALLGHGYLVVRIASTTFDDRPFPQEVVGRTPLVLEGGRVVGVPREQWGEVVPEQSLAGVDGVVPASAEVF